MDGLRNGVQFYSELSDIVDTTRGKIVSFVNKRTEERDALLKSIRGSQAGKKKINLQQFNFL